MQCCVFVHLQECAIVDVHMCLCVCVFVCAHVCMCLHGHVCVCACACLCMCVCVCLYPHGCPGERGLTVVRRCNQVAGPGEHATWGAVLLRGRAPHTR